MNRIGKCEKCGAENVMTSSLDREERGKFACEICYKQRRAAQLGEKIATLEQAGKGNRGILKKMREVKKKADKEIGELQKKRKDLKHE